MDNLLFSASLYTPRTAYIPSGVGVRWGLVCPTGARARGLQAAWRGLFYVPIYT